MIPPVVDVSWWQDRREEVVLADVRWYLDGRSGREAYDQGHLPGATFVDLDRWLSREGSPQEGRNPLPDPEHESRDVSAAFAALRAEGRRQLGGTEPAPVDAAASTTAGGVVDLAAYRKRRAG